MKNLKSVFLSMFVTLFLVTACTNDEPVNEDPQQTEESESITTTLSELSKQFDLNGNVTQTDNPAGNIVLDFCFDFVYPLTLSYNNGATVEVEDLDGLIDVMLASTDELYVNGIAFPFDVETFNDDNDAIEIVTVNNDEEFIDLIEDCDFDDFETCECFEVYEPVCVEITSPNGENFTVTYPNACYAECDGFDEDDFIEDCEGDYNPGGNFECFSLNFPVSIITEDGDVIEINSEEEFANALYNVYIFDFVYPFTVTLEDQTIATINGAEDIEELLEDCFDDFNGGGNDDCEECIDEPIEPVCIAIINTNGETTYEQFPNLCYALCLGFTEADVIDCDDVINPQNCNIQDVTNYLTADVAWGIATNLNVNGDITFNTDGTLTVNSPDNTDPTTGTWSLSTNSQNGGVIMTLNVLNPYTTLSQDWLVIICGEDEISMINNTGTDFLTVFL